MSEFLEEFDDMEETFRNCLAASTDGALKVSTFVVATKTGADILVLSSDLNEAFVRRLGIVLISSLGLLDLLRVVSALDIDMANVLLKGKTIGTLCSEGSSGWGKRRQNGGRNWMAAGISPEDYRSRKQRLIRE